MPAGLNNTALLDLPLPVEGYFDGTWGDLVNNALTNYLDIAIAGTLTLTGDGAVTLDNTAGDDSVSNISAITLAGAGTATAQFAIVRVSGSLLATKIVTVGTAGSPAVSKIYIVDNAATGGTVTFKAYGQTGISVAVGEKCAVYFNGTDFVKVASSVADGVTSVSGTGTVNGITLTGTVTSTGNLTLGGTLANVNLTSQVTGTLPIANGGTGTTSTTFANLTTNVTGTLPVANGGTGVTTSTGSGNVVLSTLPTLVTPILGTPTSGNLANCTFPTLNQNTSGTAAGLSATLAVASGGTGVTTSTGTGSVVLSASPTFTGTPAAPTAANGTSTTQLATTAFVLNQIGAIAAGVSSFSAGTTGLTPSLATSGAVTLAGTLAVANGGTGVTTSTGSGSNVLSTSPTLVTPILGTPQSGNFSTGTFTWPTFNQNTTGTAAGLSATLAVASGGTGVTTSTGTGSVVLSTSPTLVTPLLGTPQSGNFSTGTFTWPTFNQNTTGTAAGLSSTLVAGSGGTGLTTPGTAGNVLTSTGSGWASSAPSGGAVAGGGIYVNNDVISVNYTIASGQNGFSVGPMTISDGYAITVSSGQSWVII
jgi:hypothetical protein